jgi:transposase
MDECMHVRPFVREAGWGLPGSLDEMVAADDPVRFVGAYIDGLTDEDWTSLGIRWQEGGKGSHGYHPTVLLGAWIWGFMTGMRSSRRLEAACALRLDLRWLTGNQVPDHNTLWRFYQAHRAGMRYLLTHSVHLAVRAGLIDLAVQAVDGTKLGANAARDRTYGAAGLDRLYERLEQAIADLEAQNATDDAVPPPRLPKQLASTQALAERVRQAREELEPDARINLTDAEARQMKTRAGIVPAYNGQAVVSPLAPAQAGRTGMLITGALLTTNADDHDQLVPALDAAGATTGQQADLTLADGGYCSGTNLAAMKARGIQILMPSCRHTAS